MKLVRGSLRSVLFTLPTAVTIGNFDGVHCGHVALLKHLRSRADTLRLPLVVVLFEPQPFEYFSKEEAPARLSTLREKLFFLKNSHFVDYVVVFKFNRVLGGMPAERFAKDIIFSSLNARCILVGHDFRFGCNRLGNIDLLHNIAQNKDAEVFSFPEFSQNEQRISSTAIRNFLSNGKLQQAAKLLGRPYTKIGKVERGRGLGGQWGIPTANLKIQSARPVLLGVYCVRVCIFGLDKTFFGVANLGSRPTVDGKCYKLEVHLLDFNQVIYDKYIQVEFISKLRAEKKFADVQSLIEQIKMDIISAKKYFNLV